ncbi:hypothetical protein SDC9_161681 [bioreactor metagenome]|uniref:Uncharacterized protein n=1 Tax=bioreactor metagenome TaxID=1076179 RepID=A0A645FQ35_9ZZZZ
MPGYFVNPFLFQGAGYAGSVNGCTAAPAEIASISATRKSAGMMQGCGTKFRNRLKTNGDFDCEGKQDT